MMGLVHKFHQAIEYYTQAIDLNPIAVAYYANRSFAYTRVELYGYAIAYLPRFNGDVDRDANKAIEIEPSFVKVSP
jgi:tetratricopeptide (TPR) repeat protein